MPDDKKTLIMKFGGKAVKTPEHFSKIADLISRRIQEYPRIAIVVSAMGEMTDELIALAKKVNPDPPRREYDMLVSAGERISIALLAMALARIGKEAVSFTGSQSGIITSSHHAEAKIIDVRPNRLLEALDGGKVAIVAGFQGVSTAKEITTLGRGGSDTTAVALGIALKASAVEFYKDVSHIYEDDPKKVQGAKPFNFLTYDEAYSIVMRSERKVLHPRAIQLAKENGLFLHVLSFQEESEGTIIGQHEIKEWSPAYEK